MVRHLRLTDQHQKAIMDKFANLMQGGKHRKWSLWSDFITMSACTLAQADIRRREKTNALYARTAKNYNEWEMEQFSLMFADLVTALDYNQEQDFLGELFMRLELGSERAGQFFTPYDISVMMSQFAIDDLPKVIEEKGYTSVNDPCCGAGALLIAFANEAKRLKINYQDKIQFVAQDVDFTAAMMCYIQLSLLGCAGYVIVGNTLTTPPTEPLSNQSVWYTPFYFRDIWHWRRVAKQFQMVDKPMPPKVITAEREFAVGANGQLQLF